MLLRSLELLKIDYRIIIILRHFLNCSYSDLAYILDIPEKTVKARLFTARRMLKETMESLGVEKVR